MSAKAKTEQTPSPQTSLPPALTGLERELLTYVERLTIASEAATAQFAALERRSTGQINTRLDALETCASSLLSSQVTLTNAFSFFATKSDASLALQQNLSAAEQALTRARPFSDPASN